MARICVSPSVWRVQEEEWLGVVFALAARDLGLGTGILKLFILFWTISAGNNESGSCVFVSDDVKVLFISKIMEKLLKMPTTSTGAKVKYVLEL